jgi:cell division protein FtsW
MKKIDLALLLPVIVLTFFGLLMIYNASSFVAFKDFGDKYHYIKDQMFWAFLGFSALTFFYLFDYRKLYNLAIPALILAIGLLFLVFVPGLGIEALGAKRWIDFQFFTVQPSEFAKFALAIYLAAWFSKPEKGRFFSFMLLLLLVFGLIIAQPDFGTATIILAEALSIYFLSGASMTQFLFIIPAVAAASFLVIKFEPYRAQRLATFLNFSESPDKYSYHVKQILIALGSGGLTGVGLGNSLQKYAYLPEATTDSIFAIVAEEVGFIGSAIVILLFIYIVYRAFFIAAKAKDNFGKLLAGGIATFLGTQILVNLGSQTASLPLTGVPLPFISYGGSALIVSLSAVGILLNISKQSNI